MGKWKIKNTRLTYDNPWISVSHHDVITPSGNPGLYGKVHFKNIAVGVIPYDASTGQLYLVRQFRIVLNQQSLEIPEGGCLIGKRPLSEAKRELKEETGIVAKRWKSCWTCICPIPLQMNGRSCILLLNFHLAQLLQKKQKMYV